MDDEEEFFDWASDIYKSDNLQEKGSQIDLTQYEITLPPIYKEPTGEESMERVEVRKK